MHPRLFQFGHIAVPTYGALTALGLVAALAAAMYFARRLSLDANKVWNLCLIGILTTLIDARLLLVITHFSEFRVHPFWVLGLVNQQSLWIMPVGILIGLAAALLYAAAEGLAALRVLDCIAPAVAIFLAINRIGAFVAGVDYGRPTQLPWGVTYTSLFSALWYRTPLGLPLHPVQLYDAAASVLILGVLLWWLPRRTQDGELAGIWLFLYGMASFTIGLYRADSRVLLEALAIVGVIAGGVLWLHRPESQPSPANAQPG